MIRLVIVIITVVSGSFIFSNQPFIPALNLEREPVVEIRKYRDGEYVVDSNYDIPYGYIEPMRVTVVLSDDKIASTTVSFETVDYTSTLYQAEFKNLIRTRTIGRHLDEVSISRVGGASLTTGAYNKALEKIKAEAVL